MSKAEHIIKYAAIVGMLLSFFLLYTHYEGTPFCIAGNHQVCDAINQSIWSEFFGIPIAALGALTFAILALITQLLQQKRDLKIQRSQLRVLILALSGIAVLFETYITYMAKTVMGILCPYCLIIYSLLIIIFICAWITRKEP